MVQLIFFIIGFACFIGFLILKFFEQHAFLRDVAQIQPLQKKSEIWFANNFLFLDISSRAKVWIFLPINYLVPIELLENDINGKYRKKFKLIFLGAFISFLLFLTTFIVGYSTQ